MPLVREINYNGYTFRSKIEASWAYLFDQLGIEYYYENETFSLENNSGGTTNYLPDFFLPDMDCFLEVKLERKPTVEECVKCYLLAVQTGKDVVMVYQTIGTIQYDAYIYEGTTGEFDNQYRLTMCPMCCAFGFTHLGIVGGLSCECRVRCAGLANDRCIRIKAAIDKTRKNRFGA